MDLHHLIDAGENDSLKCPKCALALAGSPEPGRLKPGISCDKCHQGFHYECIKELEDTLVWGLEGDDFFVFTCETCAPPEGRALRMNLSWLDVVHITLFTLTHTSSTPENTLKDPKVESYFSLRGDILPFIVVHWHHFWEKDSSMAWTNSVASCLANHEGSRFIRHNEPGYWGLLDAQLYPSQHGVTESLERMHWAVLYELNNGRLVPPTPRKVKRRKAAAAAASGEILVKHRLKRKKRSPRPIYGKDVATIMMFPDLDNLPGPVRMSNHPTHTATQVSINEHGDRVSNAKGYRTAKASHAVHHGAWYWELKRTNTRGMTRCGFAQISADLQGPCGMDIFGYSFRADPPTTFHKGTGETYGIRGYDQGDILGLLLFIPTITPDQERDLQERFWQMEYRYEAFQYKSPSLEQAMSVLRDSEICYFLNGVCLGVAFKDLYLGRYYPAVSCYEDAEVQVNFGPEFVHPPPRSWKDLSVRAFCELEQEILPGEVQRVLAFEGEEEFGLGEDVDEEEEEEEEHLSSSSF